MKYSTFMKKGFGLIDKFQSLINSLPDKGNTSAESQKVTLQIALNKLEHSVTGVTQNDMRQKEETDEA